MEKTCQILANKWNTEIWFIKHKNSYYALTAEGMFYSRKKNIKVIKIFKPEIDAKFED